MTRPNRRRGERLPAAMLKCNCRRPKCKTCKARRYYRRHAKLIHSDPRNRKSAMRPRRDPVSGEWTTARQVARGSNRYTEEESKARLEAFFARRRAQWALNSVSLPPDTRRPPARALFRDQDSQPAPRRALA